MSAVTCDTCDAPLHVEREYVWLDAPRAPVTITEYEHACDRCDEDQCVEYDNADGVAVRRECDCTECPPTVYAACGIQAGDIDALAAELREAPGDD